MPTRWNYATAKTGLSRSWSAVTAACRCDSGSIEPDNEPALPGSGRRSDDGPRRGVARPAAVRVDAGAHDGDVELALRIQIAMARDQWWVRPTTPHPPMWLRSEGGDKIAGGASATLSRLVPSEQRPLAAVMEASMETSVVREAVGLFHDEGQLQAAADDLLVNGFDRSTLSLLAAHRAIEGKLGHRYQRVADLEDDSQVAVQAYVGTDSRTEAQGVLIGSLFYVGAVAAAGLVVASGGTLAALLISTAAAGGAGGAIGAILARYVGHHHAGYLEQHLGRGGLLLWVRVADGDAERRAIEILRRNGAEDAHAHALPERRHAMTGGVSKELSFMNRLGL
jgi:hypothetical protein